MIFDCFTFYDELDLLQLRLEILDAVVDRFVLCEAPFTFRGDAKPLAFANAGDRFARWRERIVPLVYPLAADSNPWINEWGQRDHLITGLAGCADEDLVLIGDCDEIPDPANVALRAARPRILAHRQRYSAGFVNRIADEPWIGTRSLAAGDIALYRTLSEVRKQPREMLEFVDGGWHFTSLGGPAAQAKKIRSASHAEVDLPYFGDLRRLEVTFAAAEGVRNVPIDATFPAPIRDDPRWSPYIWNGPSLADPALARALEHAHGCLAYVPGDAASVAVLSRAPAAWETAGSERFGSRWAGVAASGAELGAAGTIRPDWVVVDHLERFPESLLAELSRLGVRVIAFAQNIRSFATFRDVLAGGPFPAGAPKGLAEYRAQIASGGYVVEQIDQLRNAEAFVVWPSMPEVMYNVALGPIEVSGVARNDLRTFLTDAFIFVLSPRA
jgi:beta-1,4-mannosyl-glycoprotein beta-1,4-N-acetylglucosaminyltransferase